jgi:hypothetical protein
VRRSGSGEGQQRQRQRQRPEGAQESAKVLQEVDFVEQAEVGGGLDELAEIDRPIAVDVEELEDTLCDKMHQCRGARSSRPQTSVTRFSSCI